MGSREVLASATMVDRTLELAFEHLPSIVREVIMLSKSSQTQNQCAALVFSCFRHLL